MRSFDLSPLYRNTVGFDWNPETKQMYFTDNGRDWMSETLPEDELNRVTKAGEHFGAPYCGHVRREGDGYRFEPATW